MAKLVVMLGNPGVEYRKTRHNAGFMFSDSLEKNLLLTGPWQTKFNGKYIKDRDIVYLKPETFMNLSGQSVQKAAAFFGVKPSDILVVHDDIEQEFSAVKLQRGGGMQGHNGLRSIKQMLGTDDFCRLRIGIGRPQRGDVASFVLGRFTELEERILEDSFAKAQDLLENWIRT